MERAESINHVLIIMANLIADKCEASPSHLVHIKSELCEYFIRVTQMLFARMFLKSSAARETKNKKIFHFHTKIQFANCGRETFRIRKVIAKVCGNFLRIGKGRRKKVKSST